MIKQVRFQYQDGGNINKKLKEEAEEFLARQNANRTTMSQYTPKPGEQAKFDNIVFAYAKKTGLDSPKNAGNLAGFSSLTNPELNGAEVKLTNLAQSVQTLDIMAGVKVPLRSGGSVTLSSPLENKKITGALMLYLFGYFQKKVYNYKATNYNVSQ